jgi:hypothetical protein
MRRKPLGPRTVLYLSFAVVDQSVRLVELYGYCTEKERQTKKITLIASTYWNGRTSTVLHRAGVFQIHRIVQEPATCNWSCDALIFAPEVMMAFFSLMTWGHEA